MFQHNSPYFTRTCSADNIETPAVTPLSSSNLFEDSHGFRSRLMQKADRVKTTATFAKARIDFLSYSSSLNVLSHHVTGPA